MDKYIPNYKKCETCLRWKHKEEFYSYNNPKAGKFNSCKICTVKKQRENKNIKLKKGFIYGITNPAWEGWVKIGRSDNVIRRMGSYQTGSPFRDYETMFFVEVNDLRGVEDYLYNKYGFKNEWVFKDYRIIQDDIIKLINKRGNESQNSRVNKQHYRRLRK